MYQWRASDRMCGMNLNQCILHMLEDTSSHGATQIVMNELTLYALSKTEADNLLICFYYFSQKITHHFM